MLHVSHYIRDLYFSSRPSKGRNGLPCPNQLRLVLVVLLRLLHNAADHNKQQSEHVRAKSKQLLFLPTPERVRTRKKRATTATATTDSNHANSDVRPLTCTIIKTCHYIPNYILLNARSTSPTIIPSCFKSCIDFGTCEKILSSKLN